MPYLIRYPFGPDTQSLLCAPNDRSEVRPRHLNDGWTHHETASNALIGIAAASSAAVS